VAGAVILAGCGGSGAGAGEEISDDPAAATTASATDLTDAKQRAVSVEVAGCGAADPSRGSGLALADDLVLTAAHVVSSGGAIEVVTGDDTHPAELVAYDPRRDLALVRPHPPLTGTPAAPSSGTLAAGQTGRIVGAATSGQVEVMVIESLLIEMDDVRSTTRSTRRGYLTEAVTTAGDSGAGFYALDGRLIGLLFAVSTTDDGRSWITAASEIDDFVVDEEVRGRYGCDPDRSRVARQP
jgi:S1-C subfamily serine protease